MDMEALRTGTFYFGLIIFIFPTLGQCQPKSSEIKGKYLQLVNYQGKESFGQAMEQFQLTHPEVVCSTNTGFHNMEWPTIRCGMCTSHGENKNLDIFFTNFRRQKKLVSWA